MYDFINNIVGISNILIIVFFCVLVITFVFSKKYNLKINSFVSDNKYLIGSIVGLGALFSSLYYSEIVGFAPCNLCWIARIAIYPTALFFAYAYIKKESGFEKFAKIILWPGLAFSLLHNYLYYSGTTSAFCDALVSCTEKYLDIFGFLSIPLMGLLVIVSFLYLVSVKNRS